MAQLGQRSWKRSPRFHCEMCIHLHQVILTLPLRSMSLHHSDLAVAHLHVFLEALFHLVCCGNQVVMADVMPSSANLPQPLLACVAPSTDVRLRTSLGTFRVRARSFRTIEFVDFESATSLSKTVTPNPHDKTHDNDKMGIDLGTKALEFSSAIWQSIERPLYTFCKPLERVPAMETCKR